ncbi:MAG TPA: TraB/GumN family protein, partial [Verrucomicrobiota bacterium]|nr:TraB/GumN family protein [Verrucomicrobiota bacterium]
MKPRPSGHLALLAALLASVLHVAGAPDAAQTAAGLLPLWKVEGGKSPVFLLGSVHVMKPEHYPLPALIESTFSNAQVAVFETDIGRMASPDTAMKIMSRSRLPAGTTLRDVLPQDLYSNLVAHAKAAGLPPAILDGFVPPVAVVTLVALELQKLGMDPEHGIDRYFFDRAVKEKKQIVPLETIDFQIDLITRLPREEEVLFVKITLDEFELAKEEVEGLVAAWRSGDADKLEKYLNEADRQAPALFKRFVGDRNERWLPEIEKLLHGDQQAIVIVGA